jgi:hypothetical protein
LTPYNAAHGQPGKLGVLRHRLDLLRLALPQPNRLEEGYLPMKELCTAIDPAQTGLWPSGLARDH